jgi:hypothetical protein
MEGFGSSRVENKVGGAGCYDKSFKYTGCEEHCASADSGDSAGPFHLARSKKKQCRIHAICAFHALPSKYIKYFAPSKSQHGADVENAAMFVAPSLHLRADEKLAAARLPSAQAL